MANAVVRNPSKVTLSKREVEVLNLVAEGYSSADIGDALLVSKRTIDWHLANIFDKLSAANRIQAVNAARRRGLLPRK